MIHSDIFGNKLAIQRGVHCSTIVATATDAKRVFTTTDLCVSTINYQWKCSSNQGCSQHAQTYTMHKSNIEPFVRNAIECKEPGKGKLRRVLGNKKWERRLLLSVLKEKRKRLPGSFYFANNHVLINNERMNYIILPLMRDIELDNIASNHAKLMSIEQSCEHSDIEQLMSKVLGPMPYRKIGENVCHGKSIAEIHDKIIHNPKYIADRNNMCDRGFTSFGVGVATSSNGEIYVCQIYKG